MADIISVASNIKDQIIARIENLDSVEKVYPSNKIAPDGWPAVMIKSTNLEGEFSSNAENSRVYAYDCIILFPVGQNFVPEEERERLDYAERLLNKVLDDIINTIDEDFELDGPPEVLFVNAADAEWGFMDFESGEAEALKVILKVYTEKTVVSS